MSDLIIEIDQSNIVEFDIEIKSSIGSINNDNVSVNLVFEEDSYALSFNAENNNGTYEIQLPVLNSIIKEGNKNCFLEVVCQDRYFVPWRGTVELKESTKIIAKPRIKNNISEDTEISVKPRVRRANKPSSIKKNKDSSITESKLKRENKTIKKRKVKNRNSVLEIVDGNRKISINNKS